MSRWGNEKVQGLKKGTELKFIVAEVTKKLDLDERREGGGGKEGREGRERDGGEGTARLSQFGFIWNDHDSLVHWEYLVSCNFDETRGT